MARRNVLGLAAACAALWAGAGLAAEPKALTRADFQIRDPFVLPDNGTYYLYESKPWNGGKGVGVRTSTDLERWSEKRMAMTLPPEVKNTAVWAPEVHKYDGAYWLFTTLTFAPDAAHPIRPMLQKGFTGGGLQPRGVWVFRSESPLGPFRPVKAGSVTPPEWMCLDGTLWVEDGVPWMVFCHEWCQTGNGRMMAAPMSRDLARFTAEPVELFRAADAPGGGHVTDGPFLIRRKGERALRMIWSNFLKGSGYCVLQCVSESGSVRGPWTRHTPLYTRDGGHGMLFNRFDGALMLSLHLPNKTPDERLKLFPVAWGDAGLSCAGVEWHAEPEQRK